MSKSNKKIVARVALGTAIVTGFVVNAACDYAVKRPNPAKLKPDNRDIIIKRNELRKINNQIFFDMNPEDITIKGVTGLDMKAWYLPAEKETKRFVICVHGYHSNGPDEFSHMAPFYHNDLGYNYLLPDLTGHGRSEGEYIGFGSFDSKNILLWVDYLINRFGEDIEIILHGISMGATTVMNCNEMSPPDQVKLIIEDCGYANAMEEINNTLTDMLGFEFKPIVSVSNVYNKIKAGYKFSEVDILKNMNKAKNPILFIHGEADTFVPFKYGQQLYDACPVEKDYLWVPDTIHAFSYYNAKEAYEKKVKEFIAKNLDSKSV